MVLTGYRLVYLFKLSHLILIIKILNDKYQYYFYFTISETGTEKENKFQRLYSWTASDGTRTPALGFLIEILCPYMLFYTASQSQTVKTWRIYF